MEAIVDVVVVVEEHSVVGTMVPAAINTDTMGMDAATEILAMVSEMVTGETVITSDSTTVARDSMIRATNKLVHYSLMTGTDHQILLLFYFKQ